MESRTLSVTISGGSINITLLPDIPNGEYPALMRAFSEAKDADNLRIRLVSLASHWKVVVTVEDQSALEQGDELNIARRQRESTVSASLR